ncbi:MAG: VCBS repeat-containing protein, partial [Blastocatellia bacterium]|nr:VCBS repeat-containing protein [Blastocatellia bacterium]
MHFSKLKKLFVAVSIIWAGLASTDAQTLDAFNPDVNGNVSDIEILPDGKMFVCGGFTTVGGVARNMLARLNGDGTLDTSFPQVAITPIVGVTEMIVQPDGKILIAGGFSAVAGVTRIRLARINTNGTLDSSFDAAIPNVGAVAVNRIALQPDGKIIVPGVFNNIASVRRIDANGTADPTWTALTYNGSIDQATVLPDGKVLVNGDFSTIGGVTRRLIARLNSDGTVDTSFNASVPAEGTVVTLISVAPDGKIYAAGNFSSIGGAARPRFARLNADGSADTSFQNPLISGNGNIIVRPSLIQADGKVIIGGGFETIGGIARKNLARLNSDGTLDTTFRDMLVGTTTSVPLMIKRQPDGKILIGGSFTSIDGQTRNRIARITLNDPVLLARPVFDLDGDQKTDLSVFRPNGASSEWWWNRSSNGGNSAVVFGANTDTIVPADYTGDGKTDVAFWRPSNGNWFVLRSEDFSFFAAPFGANGDVPVPGDYDGDGKSDLAVFRPATLNWFINKSSGGTDILTFGATGDKPAPGDFDGDGKADIAVY